MTSYREIEHADDSAYYERRAAEETERAERAITAAAKNAHTDLAAIFNRKVREASKTADARLGLGPIQVQ